VKPGEITALLVETDGADGQRRRDLVISNVGSETQAHTVQVDGRDVAFRGRWGVLRLVGAQVTSAMLVGGGRLASGLGRLELPGTCRGTITAANVGQSAIAIRPLPGGPKLGRALVGHKLLVRNPRYGYTSVYTIEAVEPLGSDGARITLNMPLVVARGVIRSADATGFASQTPVMKLRVNPGLFDGKPVRQSASGREWRLKTAREQAFVLQDANGVAQFPAGGSYVVCDVGVGDGVEVVPSGSLEASR
jgi:hypothetical protein